MTEKHFIITLNEELVVTKTQGKIVRNSNSSQYIDVELDGWKLGEGEVLYLGLSYYNENTELTTTVGPLRLAYNGKLKRYVTLAPPEFITVAGEWQYSIEQRFNIIEQELVEGEEGETYLTYDSLTSAIYTLTVFDSIMTATLSDTFTKETELINAAKILTSISNQRVYATLLSEKWVDNAQVIEIEGINTKANVTIYPSDDSAAAYVLADITAEQGDGNLKFICTTVPTSDINLIIDYSYNGAVASGVEPEPKPEPEPTTYNISYNSQSVDDGSGTVGGANTAKKGETVSFTATASDDGSYIMQISVTSVSDSKSIAFTSSGNNTYSFVMPASDVNVSVTWGKAEVEVTLITFTVMDNSYQAEEGMTWEEFVASEYNTGGIFAIQETTSVTSGAIVTINGHAIFYYTSEGTSTSWLCERTDVIDPSIAYRHAAN